jgi:hypothetical protein
MAGGPQFAALFKGTCSGHGAGTSGSWHPGPGGGPVEDCRSGNLIGITALPMTSAHPVMGHWLPAPQLPFTVPLCATVIINGIIPIVNNDLLSLHHTESVYSATRTVGKCTIVAPTNAWWCHAYSGIGNVGGRESPAGHIRKCFATTKTVFFQGSLAGRMGDPLGDGTPTFPCQSVITGASPNVLIGI